VLFTDCIEYLEPPAALVAHYARRLAPGGVIGATQWLALGPLKLWEEVKACADVLDEALVQAPFGGAWQVWTARPKA
jgi:SAM-dependent methyltransferase